MSERIEVRVNGAVVYDSGAPAAKSAAASGPAVGNLDENMPYSAHQARSFTLHHGGGVMELKVDAVPGMGTFNTLTESLTGPRAWSRISTPAGTLKSHQAVGEEMPPGVYTYTVAPDVDTWMVVRKVQ